MHPAQGTFIRVERDIALEESRIQAVLLEFALAESAGKEPPGVFNPLQINDKRALKFRF